MSKKKKQLKKTINHVVNHSLERMKKLKPAERLELLLEIGEWIFNDLDLDDELMVPQFKKEEKTIEQI
ncbi:MULTISPECIES: hypothetical protein [Prochlorococcus]|uniref:Uncharacterized protein n=1 Tax=Prochlorococcus marinus (strain SARG / CCMP1375 / SS120) TaxID=167539 RepID=Q7VCY2_PROMA|nr:MULTISPECIES: hypothetical protein [Prochlorococcus]AAP99652.1 Predicted protein [Prochlorococcus marinus subsp. marinus str. CCMP1375]KGG11074.1 hypothetical protein EV04_1147 [Prochlorococcus marinus str. LG]KGG21413.1 hypothetical protein EV08_0498 [Prochlorococcus marinus str. SS2]KGG23242.1 hypothetical protein EV09_1990 [Prochlorococcus marinus str. SS35]KGG33954.1 hypothetical protein EV10_0393 [Prochlorococcus marinus str. SS51]